MVGVLWLLALLSSMSLWGFLFGAVVGVVASVWYCGRAERILGTHDPSCVVIDEISAMPLSWVGVLLLDVFQQRAISSPFEVSFWRQWPELIIAFIAFRVFDIWKPGWVGKSQRLHGGLGVTADDVLAALLAAIPVALVSWLRH
jgi:phosphatidylglycerophosphatase A